MSELGVLILVLMDNQNTGTGYWRCSDFQVLILVLMDNQNTGYNYLPPDSEKS